MKKKQRRRPNQGRSRDSKGAEHPTYEAPNTQLNYHRRRNRTGNTTERKNNVLEVHCVIHRPLTGEL